MAETKLISHRIDAETLADIDAAVKRSYCRKRSSFIDAALELLGWLCSQKRENEIMHFHRLWDEVDEFTFKKHRKHR